MKRVLLQPAFLLHRRLYRETSFLLELFTLEHGRLTAVARGLRKSRSAAPGLLQPFTPLLVSWAGSGELMTLAHVEARGLAKRLRGTCLYAGFYLNELLMSLLQKWDAHPNLFNWYDQALTALDQASNANHPFDEGILRSFEKCLLEELGYGPLPTSAVALNKTFLPDHYYEFVPEQGFIKVANTAAGQANAFSGSSLLAMAKEDWDAESLKAAKRLSRLLLGPLLGSRMIYSRQLFMSKEEEN